MITVEYTYGMLPMAVASVISGVRREGVVPAEGSGIMFVTKDVGRVKY